MTTTEAIKELCKHSLSTLPQSIEQRQSVLSAAMTVLPKNSPLMVHVREMFFLLERHRELQAELPGLFEK